MLDARTLGWTAMSCLVAQVAFAQSTRNAPPSSADIAQARTLFDAGVEHLRAEQWREACDSFDRSLALVETSATHLNLAVCSSELNRLVDQSEHLRAYLRLVPPRQDRRRVEDARAMLAELEPRLPRLTVLVGDDAPADLAISVDGEPLPREAWGAARPINPGDVRVDARATGYRPFVRALSVPEGRPLELTIALEPLPPPPPEALPPAPAPAPRLTVEAAIRRDEDEGDSPWPWVALGGAAVVAGVIAVILLDGGDVERVGPDVPMTIPTFVALTAR